MDRLTAILAAEWRAYFRRLFRTGSGAKSNLLVMGVIALLVAGRYIKFLQEAAGVPLQILFVAVFLVIAASLRNDGPLTAAALQRFPLTDFERRAIRVFSAIVPPFSWIVLIYAAGIFWPLSKMGVVPVLGGVALMVGAVAASQIEIPLPKMQPRSRNMTLFRKEMRYILALPEHALVLLITLAFCIYLIGGEGLQADALRALLGILSILSIGFPMSAFGLDGGPGLDRYALSPMSGAEIVQTKNTAFLAVLGMQRAPILLLALWRFGPLETLWAACEAAALALLVLSWGNVLSVHRPAPPQSEPSVLDGFVAAAAALLPAAGTIVILRGDPSAAAPKMFGMLALCGALHHLSLRFAGPYFSRHFDRIRELLVG